MMDIPFYISSFILATLMLVGIAESDRFLKMVKPKSKKVLSGSWGIYTGVPVDRVVGSVEVKPLTNKQKIIGGSATYAAGRGVKMNGSG